MISHKKAFKIARKTGFHLILLCVAVTTVFPFYWMIITSLKSYTEIIGTPTLFPRKLYFGNLVQVFAVSNMLRGYLNSIIIAVATTAGGLLTCSMAAYAFAKIKFVGSRTWFSIFVATLMIPGQVTLIPLFIVFTRVFDMFDTLFPLILPPILINTYGVFMIRQFMASVPDSLGESVKIDGGSHARIYLYIMLPLVKPALVTLGLFMFIGSWNNYLGQMIYIQSESLYTVPLVITTLRSTYSTGESWGLIMAGTAISIIPISVIYLFCQKFIVQGIATSGLKG